MTIVECPHEPLAFTCGYMDCQMNMCASCWENLMPLYRHILWDVWTVEMKREAEERRKHDEEVAALGETIDLLEAQIYACDLEHK